MAARSVTISSDTQHISGDESFQITASMSGFVEGESVSIKGAFLYPGSTNYFGYTKRSDGSWVKNGETTGEQPKVTIGTWDGTLFLRSDNADSGYRGEGEYQVKLGFYYTTAGGNLSSVNWSANTLSLLITEPDPTVTPSPTVTVYPTATSTSTPHPTSTPLPTVTLRPTHPGPPVRQNPLRYASGASGILGIQDTVRRDEATGEAGVSLPVRTALPGSVYAFLVIGVGVILIAFVLALRQLPLWKNVLDQQKNNPDS